MDPSLAFALFKRSIDATRGRDFGNLTISKFILKLIYSTIYKRTNNKYNK